MLYIIIIQVLNSGTKWKKLALQFKYIKWILGEFSLKSSLKINRWCYWYSHLIFLLKLDLIREKAEYFAP